MRWPTIVLSEEIFTIEWTLVPPHERTVLVITKGPELRRAIFPRFLIGGVKVRYDDGRHQGIFGHQILTAVPVGAGDVALAPDLQIKHVYSRCVGTEAQNAFYRGQMTAVEAVFNTAFSDYGKPEGFKGYVIGADGVRVWTLREYITAYGSTRDG